MIIKIILLVLSIVISIFSSSFKQPPAFDGELLSLCRSKGIYLTAFTEFLPPDYYGEGSVSQIKSIREYNFIKKNFEPILHVKGFDFHFISTGEGTYNFSNTDKLARKADSMGFKLYLNTMIWPTTSNPPTPPTWLSSGSYTTDEIKVILHDYIDTLFYRYQDIIAIAEVTNEIVINNCIDTSSWYALNFPKYYIDLYRYALIEARKYGIKICLNEDIKMSGGGSTNALFKLLHEMKDSNIVIDYIGIQSHLTCLDSNNAEQFFSYSLAQQNIDSIRSIGYDSILFTELDIGIDLNAIDTLDYIKRQANIYANWFYLAHKNKIPINLWGFNNITNWRVNKNTYMLPCLWDTVFQDTNYYTMESYRRVKKILSDSIKCFNNSSKYEIKSNWFKTFTKQDTFCYYLDLKKINIRKFWSLVNTTGSNIFITDTNNDTLPIYISLFSKNKMKGIIEFSYNLSDTSSELFYINISDTSTFNNKNKIALNKSGIVYSPDFSLIDTAIYDKCQNLTLNRLTNISNSNITDDGLYNSSINSEAYSSIYSQLVAIPNGTLSIFCNSFDTNYQPGVQKRHFRIYDSLGTTYLYSCISNTQVNFGFQLSTPGYIGNAFVATQTVQIPHTPRIIAGSQYNHVITFNDKGRRQLLSDLRRTPHDTFNTTLNFSNSRATIRLFEKGSSAKSNIYNIRLYNKSLNAFDITALNQQYLDKNNFFQYPTNISNYITVDSIYSTPMYYKYNISVNEFSDTVRIVLMDSTLGYSSFIKVDSIKGVSSGVYSLFGLSKQSSTTYSTKLLVIHENNDIDTIYGSVSTTSGTDDTLRLDTLRIRYRFSTSIPIKCYNVDINSSDSVILNASLTIRDSINISKSSNKISYNSSGKIFGWLYPSNKLYIRTNGVQNLPPVLKAAYRTWYIWR